MIKQIKLLSIIILLFNSTIFPQDSTCTNPAAGKFALQFQIEPSFSISDFQGSVFSGKYNFYNNFAVRVGIGLSLERNVEKQNLNKYEKDTAYDDDISTLISSIRTQIIYYLGFNYDVTFYFGGGPFYEYTNRKYNKTRMAENEDFEYQLDSRKVHYWGINMITGIEWFLRDNISLSAEYGILIGDLSFKSNYDTEAESSTTKHDEFSIKESDVLFGVSFYF
ncbi:MAG: PorT family protein [Melioribacteraceae bacterium]|nr:PorT family protein [Melioribacteraceae bacterium]MCF8396116.1 PorT family protein [Melioribacteraceae bacterium]MCF8421093.1 PorT family protein [Melioribacteraceae bacterium]